jgi:hypothetical protein
MGDKDVEEEVEEDLNDFDPNIYAWKRPEEGIRWDWHSEDRTWIDEETGQLLLSPGDDPHPDARTHARAGALTRQDNPQKSPSGNPVVSPADPPIPFADEALRGHMRNLDPSPDPAYMRGLIARHFRRWKAGRK